MTNDPPSDAISGIRTRQPARTRLQSADGTHVAESHGPQPTRKTRASKTNSLADIPSLSTSEGSGTLILRPETPPVDQLDFDDRHDTRATESDELTRRYSELRKDRRTDDWQRLAMTLVGFVVLAAAYLAGFIVVSRLLPHLSPWMDAKTVGLAFVAASGGMAARSAGRMLKQRTSRQRGRNSKSP